VIPAWIALGAVAIPLPRPTRPGPAAPPDTIPAFRDPTGIAVGWDGDVYVSSAGDSTVVVYAPGAAGAAEPIRRIGPRRGLISPQALALDSRGRILVSSGPTRTEGGSITAYAPGAEGDAAPVRTIAGGRTGLREPTGLALGPRARLYVLNGPRRDGVSTNGIEQAFGSAVAVFNALASGDARPERILLEVIDTIVRPAPPPAPAPTKSVDTVCTSPSPPGRTAICQVTERVDRPRVGFIRGPFMRSTRRQRPDTLRPLDVTMGKDGGPLVLTARGVTAYDQALVRLGKPYDRLPPDTVEFGTGRVGSSRIAVGPGGEVYVARRSAGSLPLSLKDKAAMREKSPDDLREAWFGRVSISVHPPGKHSDTAAVRTIGGRNTDLVVVADMAVGRNGALYVLCSSQKGGRRIAVFDPDADGDVAPARIIEGPATGLAYATGLALDRAGRIYVANDRHAEDPVFGSAAITVFAPDAQGDAAPSRTIAGWSTRLSRPSAITVAEDGTIYVANLGVYTDDHGSVRTFAARASEEEPGVRTLMGRATRFAGPQGIAIGLDDTLYVISSRLPRVTVYPPEAGGGAPPVRTLEGPATGLRAAGWSFGDRGLPSQIAVDAAGRLYVADPMQASGLDAYGPDLGSVRVYRRGAEGNDAPLRRINGGYTKLNGPGGLAVDRHGRLYVPNRYGAGRGSVTVYDSTADGDVRPLRLLAGPATGLLAPAAVALDAHDTLYVVNAASVTVYPPGARGNAPPVRTIEAW
jgi:sugar lactone lactonase YvrE